MLVVLSIFIILLILHCFLTKTAVWNTETFGVDEENLVTLDECFNNGGVDGMDEEENIFSLGNFYSGW